MSLPEEYSENEHCKEVYAHFGLAYYESGVFETGLAIALLQVEFLVGWKKKIEDEGRPTFDRKMYETQFDAFLKDQHDQTLGNLISRLSKVMSVPGELTDAMKEGKMLRDFLAHHFFRERAIDFVTRDGRDRMIVGLSSMREKFRELDLRIQKLIEPIRIELGMRDEVLKPFMEEFKRKAFSGEML